MVERDMSRISTKRNSGEMNTFAASLQNEAGKEIKTAAELTFDPAIHLTCHFRRFSANIFPYLEKGTSDHFHIYTIGGSWDHVKHIKNSGTADPRVESYERIISEIDRSAKIKDQERKFPKEHRPLSMRG